MSISSVISIDPNDQALKQRVPSSEHFHWLWDFTGEISIRYGLCELGERGKGITYDYDPTTFVLSEKLRVLGLFPLETHLDHAKRVLNFLQALPQPAPLSRIFLEGEELGSNSLLQREESLLSNLVKQSAIQSYAIQAFCLFVDLDLSLLFRINLGDRLDVSYRSA